MKSAWLFGVTLFAICTASFAQNPTAYTPSELHLFADEDLTQSIGRLEAGVPIKLLQTKQNASQVELAMWRKTKGFGRIWYNQFSKQITDAVMDKQFMQNKPHFKVLESKEDPLTGLIWQKVKLQAWVENSPFTDSLTDFWMQTEQTYKTECSVCHKQRDPKMHDANEWIAVFSGMVGFTDMDEPTRKQVLRYLQMHASDSQLKTAQ
ncbi:pentahemic C cytochrome [Actinobacillus vicugnae]|uniref:pentahemic C cytochrome n=1 Tax=Actinobacillus vicugnae TaxID=2573093 RepID=UPI0012406943|nr:pentahemic C cytochrome [Actinobacillus vicugnae]